MSRQKQKSALPIGTAVIIDDEPQSQEFLTEICRLAGYKSMRLADGFKALRYLGRYKVDLIVVDFRLPGIDGLIVAQRARGICPGCPIVLTSNYAKVRDVEKGYSTGADDFILRPIEKTVMVERLQKAVERRRKLSGHLIEKSDQILGGLNFDHHKRTINWFGNPIGLTPRELQVIRCLTGEPGRYFKFSDLYMALYGLPVSVIEARAKLLPTIKRLRNKLENGGMPRVIQGKRGAGLRWNSEILNAIPEIRHLQTFTLK